LYHPSYKNHFPYQYQIFFTFYYFLTFFVTFLVLFSLSHRLPHLIISITPIRALMSTASLMRFKALVRCNRGEVEHGHGQWEVWIKKVNGSQMNLERCG
jgi:hypothetical protein